MKAKKALKRMNKIETILSDVIEQCPASARGLRGLLDSAKTSVVRAKGVVHARVEAKKPARAQESTRGALSAEGRRRISHAAKKRWAAAKRNGMNGVTGRPLSRTA